MKITITAAGTRGDVQPCVALALGLKGSGHDVTVASWEPFRRMAENRGLTFRAVAGPAPRDLLSALVGAGRNPLKYARRFRPLLRPHVERGLEACLAACADADAVVYSPLGFGGFMAAEHLGIPAVGCVVEPLFVRSSFYPSAVLGSPPDVPILGGLYNRLSHLAVEQIYWRIIGPPVAGARKNLGLPAPASLFGPVAEIHRNRRPILLGWSRHVLPEDPTQVGHMPTTGYWFLDHAREYEPPGILRRFLDAGDPPVALALGSMTGIETAQTRRIVSATFEALRRTGMRGVLLSEDAGIDGSLPDRVARVPGDVPYDWLFPRVAAVVHHGGAGTVATALRFGTPSVVVPVLPDQAFWAWRAAALGVCPPPLSGPRLDAEGLSKAIIVTITDPATRESRDALSARLSAEDGVARAVGEFERLVANR